MHITIYTYIHIYLYTEVTGVAKSFPYIGIHYIYTHIHAVYIYTYIHTYIHRTTRRRKGLSH
jgi:hypothetical protein